VISFGVGHASEIQIVKNQYVRNAGFACCILSHVPSCWPFFWRGREQLRWRVIVGAVLIMLGVFLLKADSTPPPTGVGEQPAPLSR
jgi:hypothetical protein